MSDPDGTDHGRPTGRLGIVLGAVGGTVLLLAEAICAREELRTERRAWSSVSGR